MRSRAFITSILSAGWLLVTGCSREAEAPRTTITADASAPGGVMQHGNHNPKYGGVVMMNGDLHFEVVAKPDGSYALYFSDYARRDLPASLVSNVMLAIKRPGYRAEHVDLHISSTGEDWEGHGGSVDDKDTDIRVNYTYQGRSVYTDMPFFVPSAPNATSSVAAR